MTRRRPRRPRRLPGSSSTPAPVRVPPLDDDIILSAILLRLPPLPSSLPRASLVCKRWRRLVSDSRFLRRFREHHRKPPLLGFFSHDDRDLDIVFASTLDPPDLIPAARFSLRLDDAIHCKILGCRHGRLLVLNTELLYFLVWDPVTGDQRRVAFPPSFGGKDKKFVTNGAIVCAAGEQGHVHGSCHSSPFQVVLLGRNRKGISACVYSSETGAWGNEALLLWPQNITGVSSDCPSALVGSSICWLLTGTRFAILEFDLCRQSLSAIDFPSNNAIDFDAFIRCECQFLITPADGGGLNFLVLSGFTARVWKCKANCDGVAGWVLDLNNLLSLRAVVDTRPPEILGLAEDDNSMFLWTDAGVFALHLESLKFKKLSVIMNRNHRVHHPFTSFYSAGHIAEGSHRLSTLNSTTGSTKGTISSVIQSESAESGMGIGIQRSEVPSMVNGHKSLFGVPSAELDAEQTGLSNEGDDCENLIPHSVEPESTTGIAGVQGTHSERSRSQIPDGNGTSSSSTVTSTLESEKIKSTVVEIIEAFMEFRKQHKPAQEFSIAECINAMREMSGVSDEEKVLSCDLFRDDANREIFLSLDGTLRTMWLKKQLTEIH